MFEHKDNKNLFNLQASRFFLFLLGRFINIPYLSANQYKKGGCHEIARNIVSFSRRIF